MEINGRENEGRRALTEEEHEMDEGSDEVEKEKLGETTNHEEEN